MVAGGAMISEASVGNEISQRLCGSLALFVESNQLRKYTGTPERRSQDPGSAEPASPITHGVEVQREPLAGGVGHHPETVERQLIFRGLLSHTGSFHFDRIGAGLAKVV